MLSHETVEDSHLEQVISSTNVVNVEYWCSGDTDVNFTNKTRTHCVKVSSPKPLIEKRIASYGTKRSRNKLSFASEDHVVNISQ